MISIVRGNDFTLIIPLEKLIIESGNKIVVPFYPGDAELTVYLINDISKTKVACILEDNILRVEVKRKNISNGLYGIEIIAIKDGINMRSMNVGQFRIVESNDKADYSDAVEFGVDVHQLQSQVFVLFGVSSGPAVSDYDKLENRPRINEVVLSGDKTLAELGIQPKGDYIADPNYVHTDNNFTKDLKERIESLNNYDDRDIRSAVTKLEHALDKLVDGDVNGVIDAFNEIETFLAGITESDSLTKMLSDLRSSILGEIPDWAKQAKKPTYTASEVGALPSTATIPAKVSELDNDSKFVTEEYVTGILGDIGSILDEINGEVI